MGFDWEAEANGEGGGEKIPNGIHRVTGSKVVMGKGPKGPWVLLVVEDDQQREASCVFTLTEKASWTLARWLSRCGADLKALKADGIEPKHFVNEAIAEKYLVGSSCWVRIGDGQNPKYKDVESITEEEAKAEGGILGAGKALKRTDLPHGPGCDHTVETDQCDIQGCLGSPF